MSIIVKMTSDFICPWCLIGEARLSKALESLPEEIEVEVEWLPFELNPTMPMEGMNRKNYRVGKFGSWERSQELDAQTIVAGKQVGVTINYNRIARTPNTFAAHRLSWLAAQEDVQGDYVKEVLKAYFEQGRDIGDVEVLTEVAATIGLDAKRVSQFLGSNAGAKAVRALKVSAQRSGVQAVPHFNIDGAVIVGAQAPETLRRAINEAHQRMAVPG